MNDLTLKEKASRWLLASILVWILTASVASHLIADSVPFKLLGVIGAAGVLSTFAALITIIFLHLNERG